MNDLIRPKKINQLAFILFTLILLSLPSLTQSYTLSISSSQPYTGVASTYYFTLQNHNNPTNLVFTFSTWSPNLDQPFTTSYRIMDNTTGNSLTCTKRFNLIIECNLTAAIFIGGSYPSKIILKMTNIFNPSSLKPYPITVFLNSSLSSQTQTANLTIFLPRQSSIFIDNYSSTIGQKSSSLLYLDYKNFLTSSTVLTLTYNSSLVTIDMLSDSSYTIGTDVVGTKKLTGWNPSSQMLKTLKINITNPSVAVAFTIEGMLTFSQNGNQYKIESYSIIIQPTALAYTSIGTSSTTTDNKLYMGLTTNTLSLFAQCPIATINSPTKNSYFQLTYDNTLITVRNTSNCLSSTTNSTISTCTISIPSNVANANNTFQWTSIYSLISTSAVISNVSLKIKSWSYFSPMVQFYAVCQSTLVIDVVPQVILPSVNLVGCLQGVGAENTLQVNFAIQNALANDVIGLKLSTGKIINKTGSLPISYNSLTLQQQSPITSSLFTTPTTLQLTLTITNPTFLPSQQPSILISLYRKLSPPSNNTLSNIYGQTSISLSVCPVTVPKSSSNSLLTLSSSFTYMSNVVYYVQLRSGGLQLKDYGVNDYMIVNFKSKITNGTTTVQTDSSFQLSTYASNNLTSTPQVTLNSQYILPSQKISSSKLKITLNSSTIVNLINTQGVSSLFIAIKSLTNPYFVSDTYCVIETYYTSLGVGLLKQTLTTSTIPITISTNAQLSISTTSSIITSLQTNNTITLQITSNTNKLLLSTSSYSFITQVYIVVKMPFSCSNTNGTNQIIVPMASINASVVNVRLTLCNVGYFQDYTLSVEVKEFARFTHSNLTVSYLPTTSSTLAIKTTCSDQCHLCDTTTLKCLKCFNSTHNLFNYLYPSTAKCYQTCPNKTFGNGFTCEDCHQICQSCVNSLYSSCTKCSQNYVKNSMGICESTCGSGKYLDSQQKCKQCDPNCLGCMNATHCYSCQPGAVSIDNMCIFSQCQSPCATCSGSMDNCLTCITPSNSTEYYFYQNKCYQQCPQGTFQWQINNDPSIPNICKQVQSANVYFVGIVLCVIAFGIGMGIRCCRPKRVKFNNPLTNNKNTTDNIDNNKLLKATTTTKLQRKLSQTFNHTNIKKSSSLTVNDITNINNINCNNTNNSNTKLYKLNILRFMTVLMGYIQVVCAVVILIQGGVYNPKGVNQIIIVGLIGLVVTNFIFGFRYYRTVYKKLQIKRKKFISLYNYTIQQNMSILSSKRKNTNNNNNNNMKVKQQFSRDKHQQQKRQNKPIKPQQIIDEQQIVVQNNNITNDGNNINMANNNQQSIIIHSDVNNNIDNGINNIYNNDNTKSKQHIYSSQQQQQHHSSSQYNQKQQQQYQQQHLTEQQRQRIKQYKQKLAQFDNQMVKQLLIAILSTIFTLRTYNILRSNLFVIMGGSNNNNSDKSNNINDNQLYQQHNKESSIMRMGINRKVSNTFNQQQQQLSTTQQQQVMGSYSALKLPHQLLSMQGQQQQGYQKKQNMNQPIEIKKTQPISSIGSRKVSGGKVLLPMKKNSSSTINNKQSINNNNNNNNKPAILRETMKLKLNNNTNNINNVNANNNNNITGTQRTNNTNKNINSTTNRNNNNNNNNTNNTNTNNNNNKQHLTRRQQQQNTKPLFNVFNNNNQPLQIQIQPTIILPQDNNLSPQQKQQSLQLNPLLLYKHQLTHQFYHPFYTYLLLSSLFFVSLMFAISSAILIFKNRYDNMMIWGIDALIVISISFLLNIFDLWKVVNLTNNRHQQQNSQWEDNYGNQGQKHHKDINQTMENIIVTQQIQFDKDFDEKLKGFNNHDNSNNNNGNDIHMVMGKNTGLNQTKKLNISKQPQQKKPFMPLKVTTTIKNKPSPSLTISQNDIQIKPKSISSPKSPSSSMKSNKTKVFRSKITKRNNNNNNNSDRSGQQYMDEQPPELKIFDDLGQEDDNNIRNTANNRSKLSKQQQQNELNRTRNTQLSKAKSQNKSFNGRKTQMSMQLETMRSGFNNNSSNNLNINTNNKTGKNYKLDDIYLGFLQPQQQRNHTLLLSSTSAGGMHGHLNVTGGNHNSNSKNNNNIQKSQQQNDNQQQQQEIDEIETVKLSATKEVLLPIENNNKQQSMIDININNQPQQCQQPNKNQTNSQSNNNTLGHQQLRIIQHKKAKQKNDNQQQQQIMD